MPTLQQIDTMCLVVMALMNIAGFVMLMLGRLSSNDDNVDDEKFWRESGPTHPRAVSKPVPMPVNQRSLSPFTQCCALCGTLRAAEELIDAETVYVPAWKCCHCIEATA